DTGVAIIADERAERLGADRTLTDAGVAVATAPERSDRVIEVEEPDVLHTEDIIDRARDARVVLAQIVARCPDMACVDAEADAVADARVDPVAQVGEFLQHGAECVACAGSRLEPT